MMARHPSLFLVLICALLRALLCCWKMSVNAARCWPKFARCWPGFGRRRLDLIHVPGFTHGWPKLDSFWPNRPGSAKMCGPTPPMLVDIGQPLTNVGQHRPNVGNVRPEPSAPTDQHVQFRASRGQCWPMSAKIDQKVAKSQLQARLFDKRCATFGQEHAGLATGNFPGHAALAAGIA